VAPSPRTLWRAVGPACIHGTVKVLVRSGRLAIVALVVAVLFAASLGAGYFLGQSAFRSAPPPANSAVAPPAPVPSEPAPASPGGAPGGTSGSSTGGTPTPGGPPAPNAANSPGTQAAPPAGAAGNNPPAATAPPATTTVPVPQTSPDAGSAAKGTAGAPPAQQQAPGSATSGPASSAPGGNAAAAPAGGPAAVGAAGEVTRFHVQVGAFDTRQNAAALALRLRSLGYAVTLVEGPPYRVWVGGYVDGTTAQALADNLDKAGFPAILTPR